MGNNEIQTGSEPNPPSDRYAAWRDPATGRFLQGRPAPGPECTGTPRCGARRRRDGEPCLQRAKWSERSQRYTRCQYHGGNSTGPKNPAQLKQIKEQYAALAKPHADAMGIVQGLAAELGIELKIDGQKASA